MNENSGSFELHDLLRCRRVLRICERAIAVSPEERHEFLLEVCGGDLSMVEEVEILLRAVDDSGWFFSVDLRQPDPF